MYKVSINNENRILVQCNWVNDNRNYVRLQAVYDTGAMYTCIDVNAISIKYKEADFVNAQFIYISGINGADDKIKCYKKHIDQFYLGNILIPGVDIWITFDKRITDSVVGVDILSRVNILGIANSNEVLFFKEVADLIKYINEHDDSLIKASQKSVIANKQQDTTINFVIVDDKGKEMTDEELWRQWEGKTKSEST